ncbi:MAG: hypothetical protein ACLS8T_43490, partial [Anaerobutyricum sp.]
LEAGINLVVSIVLAKLMGAAGVFLGTIISMGIVYLYSYPKYVCKPLFDMSYGQYVGKTAEHLLVLLVTLGITEACTIGMKGWNPWLQFFVGGVVAVVVFHGVFLGLYGRSREMKYYLGLVKSRISE